MELTVTILVVAVAAYSAVKALINIERDGKNEEKK